MVTEGRVEAEIDLAALRHNLQIARNTSPDNHIMAVVKANAYGHGLAPVVRALGNADMLAVTDIREALTLNDLDITCPILLLQGIIEPGDLDLIALHNVQCVVHSIEQLDMMENHYRQHPPPQGLRLWLKMDSGMGRLGIVPDAYEAAWQRLSAKPWCREVVAMTHLANSSLPGDPLTTRQHRTFEYTCRKLRDRFPALATSISASSALLGNLDFAETWRRPGLMLYGSSPFAWGQREYRAEQIGLLPVMTLTARLLSVKNMKKGDNVGYCSQFSCPHDMRIGIVSAGYADGYPGNAPNGTPVLVNGRRTTTLGRVSMDMLAVDLSDLPQARAGDPVTLWGRGLSADEVAAHTGIISYNLFCSVTRRVTFTYHDS